MKNLDSRVRFANYRQATSRTSYDSQDYDSSAVGFDIGQRMGAKEWEKGTERGRERTERGTERGKRGVIEGRKVYEKGAKKGTGSIFPHSPVTQ